MQLNWEGEEKSRSESSQAGVRHRDANRIGKHIDDHQLSIPREYYSIYYVAIGMILLKKKKKIENMLFYRQVCPLVTMSVKLSDNDRSKRIPRVTLLSSNHQTALNDDWIEYQNREVTNRQN